MSDTAQDYACEIKDAFISSRSDGIDAVKKAMHTLPPERHSALESSFAGLPEAFDEGRILEIAKVDDLVAEYMIVLNEVETENIYLRIVFEKHKGKEAAIHLHYGSDLKDVLAQWPLFSIPKPVNC
ncbi:hypothetical protein J7426_08540 [Tropicibacter sp. R16_0]|uniref:hypothetical protein n=1 Tax=Tropicibacter sp. R16_0 TaxID=2821102 RepID=UPI001ADC3691|nr:hypothetical protein [Tropicibacter sp. R16_0]MBO9450298.1 hypothetical protein [Tropicibacter sp. R16_0]